MVVYFLILTELMRFSVEVLCCEVFKFLGKDLMDFGIRSGTKVKFKDNQKPKLGDAPEGIPSFVFAYR